jgi:hypothetical protein
VITPVFEALAAYDDGRATLADVQAAASAAAGALDSADADLRRALERLDADFEATRFTVRAADQPAAVSRLVEQLRRLVTLDRKQPYCDWCFGPITDSDRRASDEVGLDREFSWACDACLAAHRFSRPPDGWHGPDDEWPFREA